MFDWGRDHERGVEYRFSLEGPSVSGGEIRALGVSNNGSSEKASPPNTAHSSGELRHCPKLPTPLPWSSNSSIVGDNGSALISGKKLVAWAIAGSLGSSHRIQSSKESKLNACSDFLSPLGKAYGVPG